MDCSIDIDTACDDILLSYPNIKRYCDLLEFKAPVYIKRFAVTSALSVMTGAIAATRNTPHGSGLIQYFNIVAGSGVGKGAPIQFARDVLTEVNPMLVATRKPRSDLGLTRRFREQPALTYFFEEFGQWFGTMCSSKVSSQQSIAAFFLEAWDCPAQINGGDNNKEIDSTECIYKPVLNMFVSMTNDAFARIVAIDSVKHDGLGGRIESIILSKEDEVFIESKSMPLQIDLQNRSTEFRFASKLTEIVQLIKKVAQETIEDIDKAKVKDKDENTKRDYDDIKYRPRKPFEITEDAVKLYEQTREAINKLKHDYHGIIESSLARLCLRAMRTACILCAWDERDLVSLDDYQKAYNFHQACFSNSLNTLKIAEKDTIYAKIEERIIRVLTEYGELKWSTIRRRDSVIDRQGCDVLDNVKRSMILNKRIFMRKVNNNGRTAEVYSLEDKN